MDILYYFKNIFIKYYQYNERDDKLFLHALMLYAVNIGINILKILTLELHLRLGVPCI